MRTVISTNKAPGAIGPYSQGIATNHFIFTSGQLPLNMATGELEYNDIKKATLYALDNVKAIIEEAGGNMANIVKVTVFLTNMDDFAAVNEVYAGYFTKEPPARSCIAVAALPKGVNIEIEAIALK